MQKQIICCHSTSLEIMHSKWQSEFSGRFGVRSENALLRPKPTLSVCVCSKRQSVLAFRMQPILKANQQLVRELFPSVLSDAPGAPLKRHLERERIRAHSENISNCIIRWWAARSLLQTTGHFAKSNIQHNLNGKFASRRKWHWQQIRQIDIICRRSF